MDGVLAEVPGIQETGVVISRHRAANETEVKAATAGRVEIKVFPNSQLGTETAMIEGLQLGTVDMIISGPSFAARSYPRFGIAYYPFIFRDADHLLAYSKSAVFKEMIDGLSGEQQLLAVGDGIEVVRDAVVTHGGRLAGDVDGLAVLDRPHPLLAPLADPLVWVILGLVAGALGYRVPPDDWTPAGWTPPAATAAARASRPARCSSIRRCWATSPAWDDTTT